MPKTNESVKKTQITVVGGYHYGKNRSGKNYITTSKEYFFQITPKTKYKQDLKKNVCCQVDTRFGKSNLIIHDILHAKGSVAIKRAKELKPVIKFYSGKLQGFIAKLYKWNILDKDSKNKQ